MAVVVVITWVSWHRCQLCLSSVQCDIYVFAGNVYPPANGTDCFRYTCTYLTSTYTRLTQTTHLIETSSDERLLRRKDKSSPRTVCNTGWINWVEPVKKPDTIDSSVKRQVFSRFLFRPSIVQRRTQRRRFLLLSQLLSIASDGLSQHSHAASIGLRLVLHCLLGSLVWPYLSFTTGIAITSDIAIVKSSNKPTIQESQLKREGGRREECGGRCWGET